MVLWFYNICIVWLALGGAILISTIHPLSDWVHILSATIPTLQNNPQVDHFSSCWIFYRCTHLRTFYLTSCIICLYAFVCTLQPVKRLRSVSMPGENPQSCIAALETSNNYLRPPLERLPSFTQSIKRLDTHTNPHTPILIKTSLLSSILIFSSC